jgi:dihydroorotase
MTPAWSTASRPLTAGAQTPSLTRRDSTGARPRRAGAVWVRRTGSSMEEGGHAAAAGERRGTAPTPVPLPFCGGRRAGVSARLLLRGARLYDPARGLDRVADLLAEDGAIAAIGGGLGSAGARIVPGEGLIALPGFIDLHVHLREPGETHKEDIASGALAAARGGFTAVVAMANTRPPTDRPERLAALLARARAVRRRGGTRVWFAACLTEDLGGRVPVDASALAAAGAVALSDDGLSVADPEVFARALRAAAAAGLPVFDHAEDPARCAGGVVHDGPVGLGLGLPTRPAAAEAMQVARDLAIARAVGAPLHVQHVSTAAAVELVRAARAAGERVTAEATPHHLLLTERALLAFGSDARVNPPLREEVDREALWRALVDGAVDAVATDHAPHALAEKALPLAQAPAGISGLETAVALLLTEVHAGRLSLGALVERFAYGPARILGREPERIAEGAPLAVTLIAPDETWTIDPDRFVSKGRNTPFRGRRVVGRPAGILIAEEESA